MIVSIFYGYIKDRYVSSSTLIYKTNDKLYVFDPGADRRIGLYLKKQKLNIAILTHNHIDHLYNIKLLPRKTNIVSNGYVFKENQFFKYNYPHFILPLFYYAHSGEDIAFYFKEEKLLFAGDLFWWIDQPPRNWLNIEDPYAISNKLLKKARKQILESYDIDVIIPGHGKPLFLSH